MCRSINAQEFWTTIGTLAEANPTLSFNQIEQMQYAAAQVRSAMTAAA